ncbi:MAG: hypothetical protein AAGA66_14800 [Bacteroidota bacterium]
MTSKKGSLVFLFGDSAEVIVLLIGTLPNDKMSVVESIGYHPLTFKVK